MSPSPGLSVTVARSAADLRAAYAIRHEVFVQGQHVSPGIERDEEDAAATHLLAWRDGRPVGTVRLVRAGAGVGVLGRLAVVPPARGHGIGVALVRALEEVARAGEVRTLELHAQTHAVRFYERLGYAAYGPEFLEAGIPHRSMRREV